MTGRHHQTLAFAFVGAATAALLSYRLSRFVFRHFLRRPTDLAHCYGTTGWAIVTGASRGIGRELALGLARRGFSIVLMARTESDLKDVARLVREEASGCSHVGVDALVLPMDASTASEKDVDDLVETVKGRGVSLVVNCAAILNELPCRVDEMNVADASRVIAANCIFPVMLSSKLIPLLRENAERYGHAGLVLVGSLTSTSPFPLHSTYAASKAFVSHWARCVAAELEPEGIDVLSCRPGLTASQMSGVERPGGVVADARVLSERALGMVGMAGVKDVVPYPIHATLDWLGKEVVPEALQDAATRSMGLKKQREMAAKPARDMKLPVQ